MGSDKTENASTTVDEPKLPYRLGELPILDDSDAPRGGINPKSPMFDKIGQQFLQFFIDHARLSKKSKVLDVGCGTGRIAKALDGFLEGGKYTGLDANKRFIDYCESTYKRFKFDHCDVQHDEYNPDGTIQADKFEFPYENGSFDFVCAIALFNHIRFDSAANYIREMSRVLKPQGTFFATFILLNQRSMQAVDKKPEHPFKFDKREHDGWHEYTNRPFWNIALPEMAIRRAFVGNRMMIKDPIRYGEWCGSAAAITGHDVVIAIKGHGWL